MTEYKCPHWTEADYAAASNAKSFEELGHVGVAIQRRMPRPLHQVCGPISTGGAGCREKNSKVFLASIQLLASHGLSVFNQMPLQDGMGKLEAEWRLGNGDGYCMPILEGTYRTLFGARLVSVGYFLPGWESSTGTRWERKLLTSLDIEVREFPASWYQTVLRMCGFEQALV